MKFKASLEVVVLLGCTVAPLGVSFAATENRNMNEHHSNRLASEKSPYLLQHANNPVDWYPWGEEAFAKAKAEDKPILLSIGYSTCHWCHVMAHESFEDPEIAKLINDSFVPIKVDREERPDIDGIYMSAVTAISGQGGWPLTVFLTPDKKPFYGGTYFPPEPRWGSPGLIQVLGTLADAWKTKREDILKSSDALTVMLKEFKPSSAGGAVLDPSVLEAGFQQLAANYDERYGGFGSQPKFPTAHNLSFLLRYWKRSQQKEALAMVEKTLTAIAHGGIHDHLGGGFHRYSTDDHWHVPHFEKMLYDQALLAQSYLETYQATGNESYAAVARDIFDYVLRDMQSPDGGFFSAEDADSEDAAESGAAAVPAGDSEEFSVPDEQSKVSPQPARPKKEGAFYVWSEAEIQSVLGESDAEIFNYHFGVEKNGNARSDPHGEFTGKNILFEAYDMAATAKHYHRPESEISEGLARGREKLSAARASRPRPHLDDKVLTDWNGLMISALATGGRVLAEPRYLDAAVRAAQFILKNLKGPEGKLVHRFRDGQAAIEGMLADYSFFIGGLLDLYETTFDAQYLQEAVTLTESMLQRFTDRTSGGFFVTADDAEALLLRQKEIYDGALPSGNSVAALDLVRIAGLTLREDFRKEVERLFAAFAGEVSQHPAAYTQMLTAFDYFLGPSREIVVATPRPLPEAEAMVRSIYKRFLPRTAVILRDASREDFPKLMQLVPFIADQPPLQEAPTAYVCENHVCKLPVTELKKLERLLESH